MKSLIATVMLAGTVALVAQAALAQPATGRKAPIDITSDQAETQNAECISTWRGSAEALQDTSRLRADVMVAHMEVKKGPKAGGSSGAAGSGSCGDMVSLEAKGHVFYAANDGRRVHGDNAFYDAASNTITITGDVTAVQGENVLRGTKMVYNTETGEGHVEGGGRGPGAKNRPRGVFYPKDNDANQQGQAASATAPKPAKSPK